MPSVLLWIESSTSSIKVTNPEFICSLLSIPAKVNVPYNSPATSPYALNTKDPESPSIEKSLGDLLSSFVPTNLTLSSHFYLRAVAYPCRYARASTLLEIPFALFPSWQNSAREADDHHLRCTCTAVPACPDE